MSDRNYCQSNIGIITIATLDRGIVRLGVEDYGLITSWMVLSVEELEKPEATSHVHHTVQA